MFNKKLKEINRFKKSLRIANEMLDVQGQNGNYNTDVYMTGLYNGMEYIISFFEVREPKFVDCKWINYKKREQVNAKELIFIKENQPTKKVGRPKKKVGSK